MLPNAGQRSKLGPQSARRSPLPGGSSPRSGRSKHYDVHCSVQASVSPVIEQLKGFSKDHRERRDQSWKMVNDGCVYCQKRLHNLHLEFRKISSQNSPRRKQHWTLTPGRGTQTKERHRGGRQGMKLCGALRLQALEQ